MNPKVPVLTKTCARSSLFSVNAVRMSRRSTRSTASLGTAATTATISQGRRLKLRPRRGNRASTYSRCQSSSISRHQSRCAWSARPETCSCNSRATAPGLNSPRARAVSSSRTSPASVRRSSRNQRAIGTPNPVLPRVATSGGRASANARRSATLPRRPSTFSRSGRETPSSRTLWSSRGERTSSECAIEARSAFRSKSPGRYVRTSRRWRPETPAVRLAQELPRRLGLDHEPRLPQLRPQLGREDLHQPPVARLPRQRRDLEQPARTVCAGARLSAPCPAQESRAAAPRTRQRHATRQPDRRVALVPGERLVAAVAGERDGHVLPRQLADHELRQRRLVSERLVEGAREPREELGHVRLDDDLLVLRAVTLGDGPGVGALVVPVVAEPDGERPHLSRCPGHLGDDDARVDAAGKQRAQRHVGDEAPPDGRADRLPDALQPLLVAELIRPRLQRPVRLHPHRIAFGDQQVAGRQFLDPPQGSARRHVLERQVGIERGRVELAGHAGQPQQRLQLGGERERPVRKPRPEQRLLADAGRGPAPAAPARRPRARS